MKGELDSDTNQFESQGKLPQEEPERKGIKPEKPGTKVESTYALPASGPEVLAKILKAYVIASKQGAEAVKYTDVAAVGSLNPTLVSRNNAFLSEGGFIVSERWGYFKPSPETTEYAKKAPWDEQTAKAHIRDLIARTWFGETVQLQFQLQDTLTRAQLIKSFGIKATPDPSESNRLGFLVDLLAYFEFFLTDGDGNYVPRSKAEIRDGSAPYAGPAYVVGQPLPSRQQAMLPEPIDETSTSPLSPRININLNLTPATTDEELEQLVRKARAALSLLLDRKE